MTLLRVSLIAGFTMCILAISVQGRAAETAQCPQNIDVRNKMTVTEFHKAGLDKLDKKQLQALNAWLTRYVKSVCTQSPSNAEHGTVPVPPKNETGAPTPANHAGKRNAPPKTSESTPPGRPEATTEDTFGQEESRESSDRIESRIMGDFYGWTGNTVFKLKNGQVWKQAGPGYFRIHLENPEVVIKKLLIGYVLVIKGYESKEVFVRRVR